jgi:thiosulfate reductase cytochrome b subunit
MGTEKLYLYPKWLRFWHALNGILCLLLLITGLSMYFSSRGSNIVGFNAAVNIHNICGIILLCNYSIFILGNLFTSNGHHYKIARKGFIKRLKVQSFYYIKGVFKGEKEPFPPSAEQKFNPIQQFTYFILMYFMVPCMMITGLLMLFPERLNFDFLHLHGMLFVDMVHLIGGICILLFLCIHLYFATMGHKINSHFKSIINGYHENH